MAWDENGRTVRRMMLWKEFCEDRFGVTANWINRICGGKAEDAAQRSASRHSSKPLRLDGRQQAALVKAQLAANDLVAALKNGADWQAQLKEYEKVAVAPAKLDTFTNTLSPERDWKTVVVKMVHALDQCGDSLPDQGKVALNAGKQALRGQPDQQKSFFGEPKTAGATQLQRRTATNEDSKPSCTAPTISYPGGKARMAPALVGLMPREGRCYVEPFAGRGNVFWATASTQLRFERWALKDIRTAPFFEAARDFGDTVEVPLRTPEEYRRQWEAFKEGDPKAILLEPYLTFGGGGYGIGCRGRGGPTVEGYTHILRDCHRLLHSTNAAITGNDWTEIDWASLTNDDFVFIDPPYLGANVRPYGENDIDHEKLVQVLRDAKFKWMLTEYPHELYYRELGQPFFIKDMQLNAVNFQVTGGKHRRLECVWKNY